ncbi:MAG: SGNH/GDSL hydrolase family protein [Anaerolineales bacterium]
MINKQMVSVFVTLVMVILFAACATQTEQPEDNASDLLATEQPEDNASDLLALEEWDLLWISDSSGWGVAEIYAAYIEEDTGIPVNVYDYWAVSLSAGTIVDILEGGSHPNAELARIPELIPEVEVIVFYANPEESIDEDNPTDSNCAHSSATTYVNACEMDTFGLYIQHLELIYQHIFELRGDQPIIVRAFDAYNPIPARWEEDGTFDACHACWENYNAAIHQAASEYYIPVARVNDAWNGPDHNEDPNDKGYTADGIHPNELGAQVIAEELRKLGYDPDTP